MTAFEFLSDLQRQGFNLIPLPGGLLEVRPANKLTDELRRELRQRKAEVLALISQPARPLPIDSAPVWPCTRCGQPAVIEDVCPSLDGQ